MLLAPRGRMVPPLDSHPLIPLSTDVALHIVNPVNQSEPLSLFCIPVATGEMISSLQSLSTTGLDDVNKYFVININRLLDDLKIILLQGDVLSAHQLVRTGDDVALVLSPLVQLLLLLQQLLLPLGHPGPTIQHSDATNCKK